MELRTSYLKDDHVFSVTQMLRTGLRNGLKCVPWIKQERPWVTLENSGFT